MKSTNSRPDRRSFITRLTGMSAFALFSPLAGRSELEAAEPHPAPAAPWDLAWMDQFTGKHKQVFDFGNRDLSESDAAGGDSPLRVTRNFLNAHKEVYNLESPAINTIIAIAGHAFPINVTDPIWQKYSLGERFKIKDSKTGTWAVRNVFADPNEAFSDRGVSVQTLQKRGTVFWQCNNALNGVVGMLASAMKLEVPAVRAELIAGFNPGVKLVPAHTMALGLMQERGFTYESV
jgi:hypothetical protein